MLFRRGIYRLFLCLAFVLASSYAQAMSGVDLLQTGAVHHEARARLPPCHQATDDMESEKGGTHKGGCCSNFACCLGLNADTAVLEHADILALHRPGVERSLRSTFLRPLFPPPKSI